jgi:hypothetical protein
MADKSAGAAEKSEPVASRPQMPDAYGIPKARKGMLEWSRARELLASARTYWICTTRPDGRPHAVPVWGVWLDDTFYCDGHPQTRWARNLEKNPSVAVHIESEGIAIMVEGDYVDAYPDAETARRVEADFEVKYKYHPDASSGIYLIRPRVAFGWDESLKAATRWQFGGQAL